MVISKRIQKVAEICGIIAASPLLLLFMLILVPVLWLGEKFDERFGPKENWARWFAWHPVRVGPITDQKLVWLEWVERRAFYGYDPDYRKPATPEENSRG